MKRENFNITVEVNISNVLLLEEDHEGSYPTEAEIASMKEVEDKIMEVLKPMERKNHWTISSVQIIRTDYL